MSSVPATFVYTRLQRSLAAVYRFHDAFFAPFNDTTPPVTSPLEVSIPSLQWTALRVEADSTYRFSSSTLTEPPPSGVNLPVQVVATLGDYISFDPILLTLPRPLSFPVQPSDFLIPMPLWPAVAFRPAGSETAVRGQIRSATAQPVANLTVEMWTGGAPVPPAGTPFTRSDVNGEFLYRLPLLKGTVGTAVPFSIRLNGGAVAVSPATPSIMFGRTQIILFDRL